MMAGMWTSCAGVEAEKDEARGWLEQWASIGWDLTNAVERMYTAPHTPLDDPRPAAVVAELSGVVQRHLSLQFRRILGHEAARNVRSIGDDFRDLGIDIAKVAGQGEVVVDEPAAFQLKSGVLGLAGIEDGGDERVVGSVIVGICTALHSDLLIGIVSSEDSCVQQEAVVEERTLHADFETVDNLRGEALT